MSEARQRVDTWLFRARLAKTRADAARLLAEGAVRLLRDGRSRSLRKASAEVQPEDILILAPQGEVRSLRVLALGKRRGPPAEAHGLYETATWERS